MTEAVYGRPDPALATVGPDARQASPLVPEGEPIEGFADASVERFVVAAPPGRLERRFALAHALRALAPGGELVALAPKTLGGLRLAGELGEFGCPVAERSKHHARICAGRRPETCVGLSQAITEGGPQIPPALGLWSQPGVFSWDRPDPGTALLARALPPLVGEGADFGCGVGALALAVLAGPVRSIVLVDHDRRAIEAARRNVVDARASFLHADVDRLDPRIAKLDFVVMNPPFHAGGREDRGLLQRFVGAAHRALRKGGECHLVANVALPYEGELTRQFGRFETRSRAGGYKVLFARR